MPINPDAFKVGKDLTAAITNVVVLDDVRKPDLNLSAFGENTDTLRSGFEAALKLEDSPLHEVTPDSVDELFRRINDKISLGLPEELADDDETILALVNVYRVQALNWALEESKEKEKKTRTNKKILEVIDIDL